MAWILGRWHTLVSRIHASATTVKCSLTFPLFAAQLATSRSFVRYMQIATSYRDGKRSHKTEKVKRKSRFVSSDTRLELEWIKKLIKTPRRCSAAWCANSRNFSSRFMVALKLSSTMLGIKYRHGLEPAPVLAGKSNFNLSLIALLSSTSWDLIFTVDRH